MDCDDRDRPSIVAVERDDFTIKGAAARAHHELSGAPEICTICLQPITERAVVVPCNHLAFDFVCLASWLQEKATCPLCKVAVTAVQYDWRSPIDFATYHVPQARERGLDGSTSVPGRSHRNGRVTRSQLGVDVVDDPSLRLRRQIYHDKLFALHVGINSFSNQTELTPRDFGASLEQQSRARMFLRRELLVFTFLDHNPVTRGCSRQYLIEYIIAVLKIHDPKGADGQAQELLVQSLGRENATHLLHELMTWLRSPYARLVEWDQVVQYMRHDCDGKLTSYSS